MAISCPWISDAALRKMERGEGERGKWSCAVLPAEGRRNRG